MLNKKPLHRLLFLVITFAGLHGILISSSMAAESEQQSLGAQSLDTRIQNLKKEVLELNRDLFILEEDLLFPANTQFAVFLSIDIGTLFDLDSVQLKLDNKIVANHLYTEREAAALQRGGVQRLYLGNISSGKHELVAFFTGKGPKKRNYRRGATQTITKSSAPQFIELKISDSTAKQQPEFIVKVWE